MAIWWWKSPVVMRPRPLISGWSRLLTATTLRCRTLSDFNVVRGYWHLGEWSGDKVGVRIAAGDLDVQADQAVVLLQARDQGSIFGAAKTVLR